MVRKSFLCPFHFLFLLIAKSVSQPNLSEGEGTFELLFSIVQNCGIQILFDGLELGKLNILQLEKLFFKDSSHRSKCLDHYSNLPSVLQSLFLSEKDIDEVDHANLLNFFRRLSKDSETSLEEDQTYKALKKKILYYDSHSAPTVFNNPKPNYNGVNGNDYQVDFTAKPDGIHYLFPSYLEIKGIKSNHLECLVQGIKRILASISVYGLFAKHFVFVIEKYFSFILFCDLNQRGDPIIQLFLVSLDDLCAALLILNANAVENHSYFLHPHSYTLLKIFHSLNENLFSGQMNLKYSQFVKVAESSSIIFKIVFNNKRTVDSMKNTSIIIKINENEERFKREKDVAILMDKYYSTREEEYFVIGYCELKSEEISFLNRSKYYRPENDNVLNEIRIEINALSQAPTEEITNSLLNMSVKEENNNNNNKNNHDADISAVQSLDSLKSSLIGWFDGNYLFPPSPSCGIIIMEEGESFKEFTLEIYFDLLLSLRELHEMRILHRDLRSSNFLRFPQFKKKRFFVVDYDLSAVLPPNQNSIPTKIRKSSGQGQRAPSIYRNKLKDKYSIEVNWCFDDDVVMLCEYAYSKQIEIKYDDMKYVEGK